MLTNSDRQYRGVGSDRGAFFDQRPQSSLQMLLAAGHPIVGEGCIRTDEYIILQNDSIPQLHPALNGSAVADNDVIFYKALFANIAIRTDTRSRQNVHEGPNSSAVSYGLALHQRLFMFVVRHLLKFLPRP